jgi:Kef-type K+ transport system membrane component KefB
MHLVAIAWMYVVLMMAIAEALSSQGTVLGAVFTFVLYGVLPLSIVLYILGTPARKRALRRAEAQESGPSPEPASEAPDRGRHAARAAVAPEREEP